MWTQNGCGMWSEGKLLSQGVNQGFGVTWHLVNLLLAHSDEIIQFAHRVGFHRYISRVQHAGFSWATDGQVSEEWELATFLCECCWRSSLQASRGGKTATRATSANTCWMCIQLSNKQRKNKHRPRSRLLAHVVRRSWQLPKC